MPKLSKKLIKNKNSVKNKGKIKRKSQKKLIKKIYTQKRGDASPSPNHYSFSQSSSSSRANRFMSFYYNKKNR